MIHEFSSCMNKFKSAKDYGCTMLNCKIDMTA